MEASASLFVLCLIALLLTLGFLSVRLRQANQRRTGLYEAFQDHRHLIVSHLEHLEAQLQQIPDLALVWDPDQEEWRFKGRLEAEALMAFLATCRSYARKRSSAGESQERIDAIVGPTLQRLVRRDPRYHEQLCKLLTDEERLRWLYVPFKSTGRYCA